MMMLPQNVEQYDTSGAVFHISVHNTSGTVCVHVKFTSVCVYITSTTYRSQIYTLSDEQAMQLSDDMIEKFMRQYENRYDLYDPVYQKWLETNNLVSTTSNSVVEILSHSSHKF